MTSKILPQVTPIDPLLMSIATGMKVRFQHDAAMCRAVDRALEILGADLPMEFDGTELRVLSYSRSQDDIWHVTDGVTCMCEGKRFEYCRHRMLFRLKLAEMALSDPMMLRFKIIEQHMPIEEMPGDYLDSLDDRSFDEYGDLAPAAPATPFRLGPSKVHAVAPETQRLVDELAA